MSVLDTTPGTLVELSDDRWHAAATRSEEALLATLTGPVLDVGCGPGRLTAALGELGTAALGIDACDDAAALARARGASVVVRSIFERVPAEGRWATALLADGNIGIGGRPGALLRRLAVVLKPGGEVVAELDPGANGIARGHARLDLGGTRTPWFPWATVGLDAIGAVAARAGFEWRDLVEVDGRPFARLVAT